MMVFGCLMAASSSLAVSSEPSAAPSSSMAASNNNTPPGPNFLDHNLPESNKVLPKENDLMNNYGGLMAFQTLCSGRNHRHRSHASCPASTESSNRKAKHPDTDQGLTHEHDSAS